MEWSSCSGLGVMVPVLTDFGKKRGDRIATLNTINDSKVSLWRCFHLFDSNLNSASSFIIPIRSHWNGPAAVFWALWFQCSPTLV
eukprot:scaffold21222_cov69-Cyclotella_meneghiniana.AAC.1